MYRFPTASANCHMHLHRPDGKTDAVLCKVYTRQSAGPHGRAHLENRISPWCLEGICTLQGRVGACRAVCCHVHAHANMPTANCDLSATASYIYIYLYIHIKDLQYISIVISRLICPLIFACVLGSGNMQQCNMQLQLHRQWYSDRHIHMQM
jgi:hypothetical protein